MDKKISPLKGKPLRQAGQSVQERIDKLNYKNSASYVYSSVIFMHIYPANTIST
jgi:hypothetical protein